jgi:hypothetical protein
MFAYQYTARYVRIAVGDDVLQPVFGQFNGLGGLHYIISDALETVVNSPINAVFFVLTYVVLRRVLRIRVAAALGLMLIFNVFVGNEGGFSGGGALQFVLTCGYSLIVALTLLRLGLLAFMVMMFTNFLLHRAPWTADLSAWHATPMIVVIALTAGIAIFAFVQSRAGAPLLGKELLEE